MSEQIQKTEEELRLEARNTPAGKLLWSMGMDYWDTESSARTVAEHSADIIDSLTDVLQDILYGDTGNGPLSTSEPAYYKAAELLEKIKKNNINLSNVNIHRGGVIGSDNMGCKTGEWDDSINPTSPHSV